MSIKKLSNELNVVNGGIIIPMPIRFLLGAHYDGEDSETILEENENMCGFCVVYKGKSIYSNKLFFSFHSKPETAIAAENKLKKSGHVVDIPASEAIDFLKDSGLFVWE